MTCSLALHDGIFATVKTGSPVMPGERWTGDRTGPGSSEVIGSECHLRPAISLATHDYGDVALLASDASEYAPS